MHKLAGVVNITVVTLVLPTVEARRTENNFLKTTSPIPICVTRLMIGIGTQGTILLLNLD